MEQNDENNNFSFLLNFFKNIKKIIKFLKILKNFLRLFIFN